MGGLFGGSKPAAPPAPTPPPPKPDRSEAQSRSLQDAQRAKQKRGRAANILTGEDEIAPSTTLGSARTLLGG